MSLPLSIVEKDSLKKFMHDVDPRYKIVTRRCIARSHLPAAHAQCIEKLQAVCVRSTHVSLTLDIWTDRRMRSYLGVTMHTVIDDQFQSFLLSFERLQSKHSHDKLAFEFDRIVQLYGLEKKLVRLITDNASNNQAAFDGLLLPGFEEYFDEALDESREQENSDPSDDDGESNESSGTSKLEKIVAEDSLWQAPLPPLLEQESLRLPCFAHSLQLVVNDGIRASTVAASALRKVALLVKFAYKSVLFAERLEKVQVSIPKAVQTRWNSQFHTVKKVIRIPSFVLNPILTELKKNELILSTRDRKVLEEFVSLFELFNEATKLTQGEQYATISLVAPCVLGLLHDLEHELESSTLSLNSLCQSLLSSLKARFIEFLRHFDIDVPSCAYPMSERYSDPIFLITPLFDPRFKLMWLDNLAPSVKARVVDKIFDFFRAVFPRGRLQVWFTNVAMKNKPPVINMWMILQQMLTQRRRESVYSLTWTKRKRQVMVARMLFCWSSMTFCVRKANQPNILFSKKTSISFSLWARSQVLVGSSDVGPDRTSLFLQWLYYASSQIVFDYYECLYTYVFEM